MLRLRFIERAKQLGLPLGEIRDLVTEWEDGLCSHVRDRLRSQVADKSTQVAGRMAELTAFAAQLSDALDELDGPAPEGACIEGCGCATPRADEPPGSPVVSFSATPGQSSVGPADELLDTVPVVCTLEAAAQPARLEAWRTVLAKVVRRQAIDGGLRLYFRPAPGFAGQLAELAAQEQACCSFFAFAVRPGSDWVGLDVTAPPEAATVVHGMFGLPE